jgi:hypothetical protein
MRYTELTAEPRGRLEHGAYLYMAALDDLRDRAEPLVNRTLGTTPEQRAQETVEREALREQTGTRLLRQLILR